MTTFRMVILLQPIYKYICLYQVLINQWLLCIQLLQHVCNVTLMNNPYFVAGGLAHFKIEHLHRSISKEQRSRSQLCLFGDVSQISEVQRSEEFPLLSMGPHGEPAPELLAHLPVPEL